jgi:hypothetical protein
MIKTINPFSGRIYEIAADLGEQLVIENFDPTKDSIQLPANPDLEVIPQFSFNNRYILTEINGDTAISTLTGQFLAVVKGVTGLKTFTGYTEKGTYSLVSLENEFFSTYLEPNFFEPWYSEFDASDYNNSVQKAIDAGLVNSAYEHYLKFGQFEAREDGLFAPTTDGNNTLYGSGYENGLVGVPISEGFYTRDVKPLSTGIGEIDTLIGAPGEDTFFLGNVAMLNETAQPFYVGEGDSDYVLIKGFGEGSTYGAIFAETGYPEFSGREALTDRILLAGKPYDYEFEKIDEDLQIFFQDDLIAIIEDAPPLDQHFYIPGGTYVYTTGNVASFQGWGSENTLYEPFYFEENPGVKEAIANREYESALDHLVKVGQFNPEGEVIFSGSSGDDAVVGLGAASLLFGVEVTFVDGEKEGYRTATTGVGEADFAVGSFGVDTFFIGNDNILDPEKGGEVWYVGNGDEDFLTIQGFDPYKDFLFGAGDFADYSFELVEDSTDGYPFKSLEVNYQGDRVALIKEIDGSLILPDLTSLISFPLGEERPNGLALVASSNEFLPPEPPAGSEYFNADVYAAFNPDILEFIGEGKPYKDVLDYYIFAGQFREDGGGHGFFNGSSGNDVLQGFGFDKDLFGVAYTSVTGSVPDEIILVPETLGVGEIDTMIGSPGIDGFYAAAFTRVDFTNFAGDAEALYIGEGDGDYVLIKGFDPAKDYFALAGSPADYIYKVESNDFKVYTKEGDLVGIVEDTTDLILKTENIFETVNVFTFTGDELGQGLGFDREAYLGIYPEVAQLVAEGKFASALEHYLKVGQYEEGGSIYSGTSGDDVVISWTQNAEVRLSGIDFIQAEPAGFEEGQHYFGIKPATYGVGEIDTLIFSQDRGTISEALLGFFRSADGSLQRFYVGQGDDDYALVKNFDNNDLDEIFLAGVPGDYTYTEVDSDLHIAYQGDLVGIVEDVKLDELELADEGEGSGAFVLIGKPDEIAPTPDVYFNETVYLSIYPKVEKLIDKGIYESAYEHYLELGDSKGRTAFLSGSPNGNDNITALGNSSIVFGVEVLDYDVQEQKFVIEDLGIGQIDSLQGNEGSNRFILGNQGQSFYVGGDRQDYAKIYHFDPTLDSLIIAGDIIDYHFERVETFAEIKNLEISTQQGDLVAILYDIGELNLTTRPVDPLRFEDASILVSTEHQTLQRELADNFFEPYYSFNNPQAVEAVANGEYDSVYEYYLQVGRFSEEGIQFTYWEGTSGNDRVTGIGDDIGLFGVNVTTIERQALVPHGIIGIETEDTGVGTIDVLIGQAGGGETVFNLGKTGLSSAPNPTPFYVGEGDNDYALIKNFDLSAEEQFISLVGTPSDYTITQADGNTRISYHDDLIAIVEGTPNLSVLPFFSRDGRFFYASLDAEGFAESVEFNFYEDLYLQLNPDVVEAITNGEYESAFDHYAKVGRLEGREGVIFNGTGIFGGNDIVTDLGGDGESALIGVPINTIEVDGDDFAFDTANNGEGQKDTLIGTEALNLFVLGKNGSLANPTPISFYLGNGDSDYAAVWSFDETKDFAFLAGAYEDYTYETIDGNFYISQDGDLVAIFDGVAELKPFTGSTPVGGTYLVSLENEFFSTYAEPYFYAPIYPEQNPDVDVLIAAGEYTSYYDHFLKAGQFEEREDTFFVGTEGNDTLYALGYETVLVGVPISNATYGPVDVVPLSLGTGQVDTLYGGNTFEAIYVLGNGTQLNETAQSFYIGQGDGDYALIKDFGPNDVIFMGSDVSVFTQEVVDGNLKISKDGDLITIVENSGLLIGNGSFFNNFNYIQGTSNNDLLELSGTANALGVPLTLTQNYQAIATSKGVGEIDTFKFLNLEATNSIYLGFTTLDSPDLPQTFYLGNGDADYALIENFNPLTDHSILIPGKFEDYELAIVDGNTRISKDGDLIAIVENTILVPDFEDSGFTNLYPSEDEYFVNNTKPFFNETIYLENNSDVAAAIAADEYASGYQHFMRVGLLEGRDAYYNSTNGNDEDIYAMGNSYVLGVPITGFVPATKQFTTATTGMGEVDSLTGTIGVNKFVIGSNGQSFYIGNGDIDYATINSFDLLKDELLLGGNYEDYTYEVVEENLQISQQDDLVAVINGVTQLQPKIDEDLLGGFSLVSPLFTGEDPFSL